MSGETFPEFGILCGFTYRLDSARARALPGLEYRSRARRRRITTDDIAPGHPTTVRSLLVESVQEGHDVNIKVADARATQTLLTVHGRMSGPSPGA